MLFHVPVITEEKRLISRWMQDECGSSPCGLQEQHHPDRLGLRQNCESPSIAHPRSMERLHHRAINVTNDTFPLVLMCTYWCQIACKNERELRNKKESSPSGTCTVPLIMEGSCKKIRPPAIQHQHFLNTALFGMDHAYGQSCQQHCYASAWGISSSLRTVLGCNCICEWQERKALHHR